MSGATGAGAATTGESGARGPAADAQGATTVTDTRGPQPKAEAGQQRPAQPYHPPQAYAAPAGPGVQRKPRTGARTTPRTRKARPRPIPG